MHDMTGLIGALVPIAGIIWLGFVIWAAEKRKEREAFYRSELLKKIIDSPSGSTQSVLEMVRQEEREAQIRRREGLKLGGVILIAAGIGLTVLLAMLERDEPAWIIGPIPILVGAALFIYVRFMAPPLEK
jgi:uncharacterized membrane protein